MENWKTITDFEDYQISSFGNVKSIANAASKKERILKPLITSNGYFRVALYKGKKSYFKSIHRLVAEYFIENSFNKEQVNHIDGNKLNNNVFNLEWCTYRENINHAIKNNLTPQGERHWKSILTEQQVLEIYEFCKIKIPVKCLMSKYKVSKDTIIGIKHGNYWKHLNLTPLQGRASEITLKDIDIVETLLNQNITIREICRQTNYSRQLIRKIKNKDYEELKNAINKYFKES